MVEIKNSKGEVIYTYEGADLRDADLRDADLRDADLRYANLQGAYLRGADLRGAKGILNWQSPLGCKRMCYSVLHENNVMHQLGCFWGGTKEAQSAIIEKYGEGSLYEEYLLLADKALRAEGKKND